MMHAIATFFRRLVKSCYDVEWYREVRVAKTGAAFGYAALLHLLIALAAATVMVPGFLRLRADALDFVTKEIPQDASIALKNGKLTTDLKVPFERTMDGFAFILDTAVEGTDFPARLTAEHPGILLGRDAVFMRVPDEEEPRIMAYDSSMNGSVTSAQARGFLEHATVPLVAAAIAIGILGYGILAYAANVLFALSSAALLLALGRSWGAPLPYSAWLRVSLYAITLPVLVDAIALMMGFPLPFVFTGLFILVATAVFIDEKNSPTLTGPIPPAPPKEGDLD